MNTQLLLYSPFSSSRLDYAARFLLEDLLGLQLSITCSVSDLAGFRGARINYSREEIESCIRIIPSGLLEETGIREQEIGIGKWGTLPVFFTTAFSADINFDIFSATFYLLSRYEEYLHFTPDRHGRFSASSSLAFRNEFLERPVINDWARKLGKMIEKRYTDTTVTRGKFTWLSTVDVDSPWAWLNRGRFITFASLARSLMVGDDLFRKIRVLQHKEKDPFYTFDLLKQIHSDDPGKVKIFFLTGKPGRRDRNINPKNKEVQNLLREISGQFNIGLHPSYRSNKDINELKREHTILSGIINKPVTASRQHFIKVSLPETYRNLIELGIKNDYSMGFADHIGFRAGTASPFLFYDLEKEMVTDLRIWPFTCMDRTLKDYMKLSPKKSRKRIRKLIDRVRKSGGVFIPLWHNDSISNFGEWRKWRSVYKDMIGYLKKKSP